MNVSIQFTNIESVITAFAHGPRFINSRLEEAIKKATFLVGGKTKINVSGKYVNVISGRLRSSITEGIKFEGRGSNMKGILDIDPGAGRGVANYAVHLHEGTQYITPRPFLKDALDITFSKLLNYPVRV